MGDRLTPVSSVHSMASLVTYGHENSDDEHDEFEIQRVSLEKFTIPIYKSQSPSQSQSKNASPFKIVEHVKVEESGYNLVKHEHLDESTFATGDPFSDDEAAGHIVIPKKERSPLKTKHSLEKKSQAPKAKKARNSDGIVLVSYGMHEDDDEEEGAHSHRKISFSHTPEECIKEQAQDDDDMDVVASDQEDGGVQIEIDKKEENIKADSPDAAANKNDTENKINKVSTKLEQELEKKRRDDNMEASSLSRVMRTLKPEEICIPQEPPGQCSKELQDRVREYVRRARFTDFDLNKQIQDRKDFRNSSIYEKLVTFLDIDEKGTNFPFDIYDPYRWGPESFYEELSKSQNKEIEKKEKEKKDQRKVEFISSTKTSSGSSNNLQKTESEPKKRSKWDTKPPLSTSASVQSLSTDTQPNVKPATIIPAVGSLTKKKSEK